MLEVPSTAVAIGNSAVPPGKARVAAAGVCPAALFTTSLTAPPVIVTCAVTCFPVRRAGRRAARIQPRRAPGTLSHPPRQIDDFRWRGCTDGRGCHEPMRAARSAADAAASHPLVGRREREPHVLGEVHPVEVPRAARGCRGRPGGRSTPRRRAPRWPRGRARPRCGRCGIRRPRAPASGRSRRAR